MTVKELIERLQTADQDAEITVAVKTNTQVYPQAYVTPFQVEPASLRIYINLPDGMYVGKRKAS